MKAKKKTKHIKILRELDYINDKANNIDKSSWVLTVVLVAFIYIVAALIIIKLIP